MRTNELRESVNEVVSRNEFGNFESMRDELMDALKYETIVEDEGEAYLWFLDAGIDGDLIVREVVRTGTTIHVDGCSRYVEVVVTSYYKDSGSDDYVYSVNFRF